MALMLANKMQCSPQDVTALAYELAETLRNMSHYQQAAQILLDYCKDVEQAITTLLEGNEWQEALRTVTIQPHTTHTTVLSV